jgi:hypothetical protein
MHRIFFTDEHPATLVQKIMEFLQHPPQKLRRG